jgi:hypothetical protein
VFNCFTALASLDPRLRGDDWRWQTSVIPAIARLIFSPSRPSRPTSHLALPYAFRNPQSLIPNCSCPLLHTLCSLTSHIPYFKSLLSLGRMKVALNLPSQHLARMFHEFTPRRDCDRGYGRPSLRAGGPLASPVCLGESLAMPGRHIHLHGIATVIHKTSGLRDSECMVVIAPDSHRRKMRKYFAADE